MIEPTPAPLVMAPGRIGFANGCFDLLHEGHLYFLEQAKMHCGYLIVAVNSDRWIRRVKGEGRPVEPQIERMHNVLTRASAWVDAVIPFEGREDNLIMEIRPHVIIKGYDHHTTDKYCVRAPGWKHGAGWDIIDAVHIGHLPGHSTTLKVQQ